MKHYNTGIPSCNLIKEKFNPKRAFRAQKILRNRVIEETRINSIDTIGGVDLAYDPARSLGVGVLTLMRYPTLELAGCFYTVTRICIPYIPGLLAFREMPPITLLIGYTRKKRLAPDVLLVDGHGKAHPRGLGIASHVGVVFDIPSIGVAKKRLIGIERGDIVVNEEGEVIARILRRGKSKIYVSVGNRVSLEDAVKIVETTWVKGKLPKPLLIADYLTKKLKKNLTRSMIAKVHQCPHQLDTILQ